MKILVVEDEIGLGKVVCRMLTALGHEPTHVCTGDEAIGVLEGVDLVLSDIRMPGRLNGVQVRAIAHSRGIPTLLMTGWTDLTGQLGFTGKPILAKPFTAEELALRIKEAMEFAAEFFPRRD
jgi:DNA-binding response OmpR family regulator